MQSFVGELQDEAGSAPSAYRLLAAIQALQQRQCDIALVGWEALQGGLPHGGVLALRRLEDCSPGLQGVYAVIKACHLWPWESVQARGALEGVSHLHVGALPPVSQPLLLQRLRALLGERSGLFPRCALALSLPHAEEPPLAAGVRGWLTAILALHHKVLPAFPGPAEPAEELARLPFHVSLQPRPWVHAPGSPRRAGVLLLGHSGWTCLLLEESSAAAPVLPAWREEPALPSELMLLSAPGRAALLEHLREVREHLASNPGEPLGALARRLSTQPFATHRLALIATDHHDLLHKLTTAEAKLAEPERNRLQVRSGIYYAEPASRLEGKVAFLFPGQGSQYPNMLRELSTFVPQIRAWFDRLAWNSPEVEGCPPSLLIAPPSHGLGEAARSILHQQIQSLEGGGQIELTSSLALHDLLGKSRITADVMVGYSNGENAALIASGIWRTGERIFEFMRQLKLDLQSTDVLSHIPRGMALAVSLAPREEILREVEAAPGQLYLAMDNCPQQVVLFGTPAAVPGCAERLRAQGALCLTLPFDRAYHTPLFKRKAGHLREIYNQLELGPSRIPLYSCATAAPFPQDPEGIRDLAMQQWFSPVRFRETVEQLFTEGVRFFIEVGPGAKLTGFTNDILRGQRYVACATTMEGRSDLLQLQHTLAQLFVHGKDVDLLPFQPVRGTPPAPPPVNTSPAVALPEPPPPQAAPGVALSILQGHQKLMKAFLESQQRISAAVFSRGSLAPPPLPSTQENVARWPLLGEVIEQSSSHLYCRRRVSAAHDRYLLDHTLGRNLRSRRSLTPLSVVPFTFSMEMMAEAAVRLAGERAVIRLSDVVGNRWLALDSGEVELGIHAELLEAGTSRERVRVRLFDEAPGEPGGRALAAQCIVWLAEQYPSPPPPHETRFARARAPRWQPQEFYEQCLFHGPSLRSIRTLRAVDTRGIEVDAVVPPTEGLLVSTQAPRLRIPAGLLDCVGQLAGYWLVEQSHKYFGVFPFHIQSFQQYGEPPPAGTALRCAGRLQTEGLVTSGTFDFVTPEGTLAARVEGLQLRYFDFEQRFLACLYWPGPETYLSKPLANAGPGRQGRVLHPLSKELLDSGQGIWQRALAHMVLGERERKLWYAQPADTRIEWLLERTVAKDTLRAWARERLGQELSPVDVDLLPDASGRLSVHCEVPQVSQLLPELSLERAGDRVIATLSTATPKLELSPPQVS